MTNNYTYRGRHRATTAQTVTTRTRRSIALAGASAAALAGLGAGPAAADPVDDLRAGITDGALNAHDSALAALDTLDALDTVPEIPQEVRDVYGQGVTDLTDAVAPGALAQREACPLSTSSCPYETGAPTPPRRSSPAGTPGTTPPRPRAL
ncbi:hypothetical protein [Corynebacterium provencense]|uniref:hypothetical protein n=1 Tax=Corynebacterium provencense TaxID=1737425 RepID=UPI0011C878EB|nr:hypothetical protein [Corynebacterium provencense]